MNRWSIGTGALLGPMSATAPAWAQPGGAYGPGMMWSGDWYGMMFLMPLMMILFVAAIVILVVLAVRWLAGSGHGGAPGPSPNKALDILKERFARGEIDKEEFEEGRRALGE